jgi:4-amino-4-deoxy-L-arabinose transferase-like glycosyltransferase
MTRRRPLADRCILVLTLWGALATRLAKAGTEELRGDEAFGYFFSLRSFADIVRATLELAEPHPVGSYFLQKIWLALAGDSELALRFLSICAGVISVALIYRLGRQLGLSSTPSILGSAWMALSPYAIWHSQDARMYALSLALTLASTCLILEWLRHPHWFTGLAYLLVSLSALHTHYYSGFVLLAQGVFVLVYMWMDSANRSVAKECFVLLTLLALLYAPWLWLARHVFASYGGTGESPGLCQMAIRSLSTFALGEMVPSGYRPWVALLAVVALLLGLLRLARGGTRHWQPSVWLLLHLCAPLGASWLAALRRPIFNERYLLVAAAPFYLLAAVGLTPERCCISRRNEASHRARLLLQATLAAALLAGLLWSIHRHYTDPVYSKDRGWRELALAMEQLSAGVPEEQVRLMQNFPDPTLWYYYRGPVEHAVLPPAPHDEAGTIREVQKLVWEGVQRVILPLQPADWWDGQGLAQAVLGQHYHLVGQILVRSWPVYVYARPDPSHMIPLGISFANGLHLRAVAVVPSRAPTVPGGIVVVHLVWGGSAHRLVGTEKLFLHLLNQQGAIVAQVDPSLRQADVESGQQSFGILLPDALSPGAYTLITGLYDPGQTGSPRVQTVGGADHVLLGTVEVE